jgi:CRP-like cAMP-binding protein/di/tricarboxylate transporter
MLTDERDGEEQSTGRRRAADLLAKAGLFAGLDRVALAKIAAHLDAVSFARGEAACIEGEAGDSLYLVSNGSFGVFVGNPQAGPRLRVATLRPGDCFGEMALLTGEPRSATVVSEGEGELLRLDHERFTEVVRRDPSIGLALSAALSRRLHGALRSIKEGDEVVRAQVERHLARLPPDARDRVLHAALLPEATSSALQCLFGAHAPEVSSELAALGWRAEKPPAAAARALREAHSEHAGPEAARAVALGTLEGLAEAGLWREALRLAEEVDRPAFVAVLARALRADAAPPEAFAELARLSDAEAAADPILAVERAAWHRGRGAPKEALALLQRALERAQEIGDERIAARAAAEIATLGAALGQAAPDGAASRFGLRAAFARAASGRAVAVASTLVLVAGAVGGSLTSKPLAFLLLLGGAIVLWVAAILPDFVVYLGLVVGWVFLGIATPAQAIAGFGSPSWISVFAILAIASALSASGLVYRFGLMLVRRLPPNLAGQAAACLGSGLFLTLLLPSSTARARLLLPTALAAAQAQRFKDRSPESAFVGLSAFIGAVPLLYVFLNGSSSNFLALGLIPADARARFDLAFWFIAAGPLGLFVGLGSLAVLRLVFRAGQMARVSHERVDLQLSLLGPLTVQEMTLTAILIAVVVGWNVGPAFGISTGVVGLASVVAAAFAGCVRRELLQDLNWDFLVSYGVILSLPPIMSSLGIDAELARMLRAVIGDASVSPAVFVLGIAGLNILVRMMLPDDQALLLLAVILVPMAPVFGVHPWVVIITLLATFTLWFLPSQSVSYAVARDASEDRLFTHAQARTACFVYVVLTLIGLLIALPYWRWLGLL